MNYLIKTPFWLRWLYPRLTWRIASPQPTIYLTFDDGPSPEVTPFVLEQLAKYNAQATFFCIGDKVQRYPETFQQVLAAGHHIGNHTYNHVNGWKTAVQTYLDNTAQCQALTQTTLFRPPYGRITKRQIRHLLPHYKIVMWEVLAGDFDPEASAQQCLDNVLKYAQSGSIIVLHDNPKFTEKVHFVLPKLLEYFTQQGFLLKAISYKTES